MFTRSLALVVAVVALAGNAAAAEKTFSNDGNHTFIGFRASTTLFDVDGWFDKYNLLIQGDPQTLSPVKVKLEIDARSINTRNKKRDDHLRAPDFFDAKKFPKITFTSEKAIREGDKVVVDGTLEMHGVKKPLKIAFKQVVAKNGAGYEQYVYKAEVPLNRKDFGIGVDSVAAKISLDDTVLLKLLVAGFFE